MVDLGGAVPEIGRWMDMVVGARWWVAGAGAAGAAGWIALVAWWRRRSVRCLRSRAGVSVLPSATFDPSPAEVAGAGARLHRLPQTAGWLPRRARAVRIRVTSTSDGLLEYQVQGPGDAARVLAMPLFPGVEVRPVGGERPSAPRVRVTLRPVALERKP